MEAARITLEDLFMFKSTPTREHEKRCYRDGDCCTAAYYGAVKQCTWFEEFFKHEPNRCRWWQYNVSAHCLRPDDRDETLKLERGEEDRIRAKERAARLALIAEIEARKAAEAENLNKEGESSTDGKREAENTI